MNDFFFTFAKEIDYENKKISIEQLQKNTEDLRNRIDSIVQKYKSSNPIINQLNTYFNDLKNNESFFFLVNSSITNEQSFQLYNYLSTLENNEDFKKASKEMDELFGDLRNNYDIIAFNEGTRNKIGEPDKSKRVCRFCNRKYGEVTFRKVAHSISEALGNKKIITNDECDSCNEKFGTGIENDLILYLNLYRNVFGIKGKNGIPKLKGKNFEILNSGKSKIEIKYFLNEEEKNDPSFNDFKVRLETNQNIVIQNIYKTLAKYALSVLDNKYLCDFEKTIQWINHEFDSENLPKVAILTSYELFTHHPQLVVYRRKKTDNNLPYAVAEFRFIFLTFVFIIPFSSVDKLEYSNEDNFNEFWTFFKHYNSVEGWKFNKMNDTKPRKFTMNLNFELRNKE
ncbi:HNH endonuclease [uncultured Tenacibaculum sp.]|uniref:HNH endonuclease n=1 Tax=uncultured Tenacibaculum sp. TaxID=174713 RepID=UPI00262B139C|nr:HNH endonuclease [uncultured Tenacibaculum sp.]